MPSSVAHAYIALDVYDKLDRKVKRKIPRKYLEEYKAYSQGMDVLYFKHIFFPITKNGMEIRSLGHYIHNNKTNEFFTDLTKRVKESQDINQFMFLIGLLTHYKADSTIHPYINYKASKCSNKLLNRRDYHFIIETYFDNYLVNKYEKINYYEFKAYKFCFNVLKNEKESVEKLLTNSGKNVFKKENLGKHYFNSLNEMKLFFKIMRYDKYKIKRYIYNILNIIANPLFRDIRYLSYNFNLDKDWEYLNLNKEVWYNLDNSNIKSNKSILELYDDVILQTSDVIQKLYSYIYEDKSVDLEKLFGNNSYSNGLPLK